MVPHVRDRRGFAHGLEVWVYGERDAHGGPDGGADGDGVGFVEGAGGEEADVALCVIGYVELALSDFQDDVDIGLDGPCGFEGAPDGGVPEEAVLRVRSGGHGCGSRTCCNVWGVK